MEEVASARRSLLSAVHDTDVYLLSELEDVVFQENEMEEQLAFIFSGLAEEIVLAADDVEGQITALEVTAKETNTSMLAEMGKHLDRLD